MPRFLVILSPEHPTHGELSAGALGRRTQDFANWLRGLEISGALEGATRLRPAGVRISRSGEPPCAWDRSETAAVSGCLLLEADALDAAVALASACPAVAPGCIEVLEIDAGTEIGAFRAGGP